MFGWEFPPYSRGGLGTACYGLTKGMSKKNIDVIFVLPKGKKAEESSHVDLIVTDNLYIDNKRLRFRKIDSLLCSYMTPEEYSSSLKKLSQKYGSDYADSIYGKDLFEEVERYSEKAKVIANFEDFDVIHAHDWMTYKAGIKAKQVSGKPLVVHVHATDFDRTGGHPNQYVYDIERAGMHAADRVIAVSNYTKNMVVNNYGISPEKVKVVHNGIYMKDNNYNYAFKKDITQNDKIVLFLGRITLQKGPDYFIESAKRVLDFMPNVKFMVAGSGDMYSRMIERAAELGIGNKFLFTGHLSGEDINRAYQMADLYVMPSVSEPFGITPLEALKNDTPVLISKQSGVSEVLANALKVDFWDINEMTNKILSALNYNNMSETLANEGKKEIGNLSWDTAAEKCIDVYNEIVR